MGPIYVLPLSRLAREIAAIPNRGLEPQTEQSVIGTCLLSMPELDPCAPSATHNVTLAIWQRHDAAVGATAIGSPQPSRASLQTFCDASS